MWEGAVSFDILRRTPLSIEVGGKPHAIMFNKTKMRWRKEDSPIKSIKIPILTKKAQSKKTNYEIWRETFLVSVCRQSLLDRGPACLGYKK